MIVSIMLNRLYNIILHFTTNNMIINLYMEDNYETC